MIEIVHYGACPDCSSMYSQVSWQGNDPSEIPEFAKFETPVLYCGWLPFTATEICLLSNGKLVSKHCLQAP